MLDQAFVVPDAAVPSGYYAAVSPDVDAINVECYVHTRDSLPKEEDEEEDEENEDEDEDSAEHDAPPSGAVGHEGGNNEDTGVAP